MPVLFIYLLKLSICLAAMYLFYRLLLHRLTFYNLNRWYLLGYSLLSFLIPLINVSPVLEKEKLSTISVVQAIPVLNDLNAPFSNNQLPPLLPYWDGWNVLLLVLITGTLVMLARFAVQWISYLKIKRHAQPLSTNNNMQVYGIDKNIIPFSFGRAVFINPALHSADEVEEILRHEQVHVQQHHTIDIIWTELLCLFNWYNPFAWLIRHSIRQNLEFIADSKVVADGMEKKQYQYLLLKVLGVSPLPIAASFNFSSLKKRIHMMNKVESAQLHLVKFLFLLPLLAVLLLAFRITSNSKDGRSQAQRFTLSGIVVETSNYKALGNVHVKEVYSQVEGSTDERGYFTITFPAPALPRKIKIVYSKEGYENTESNSEINRRQCAEIVGMVRDHAADNASSSFVTSVAMPSKPGPQSNYTLVAKAFENAKQFREEVALIRKQGEHSGKPYWVINGHTYLLTSGGGVASVESVTDVVMVDGKRMTGKEVNEKYNRSTILVGGAMNKEAAQKKYGINRDVMEISTIPQSNPDTVFRKPAL
ncbi:MAG: M56 family metallopeptidase [Williamsia sp.]|nr:M56 family metallopeptidase [Williamsia sp.]